MGEACRFKFEEGDNLKIVICISNYVDTIDVLIDGLKIDIKKLSLFSKAAFEHNLEIGYHEITVFKRSEIMGYGWKKNVLLDWISGLLGVPDWTLKEKEIDKVKCLLSLKIEVEEDAHINLRLKEDRFELIDSGIDILDIVTQTEICETANKRIKYAYRLPVTILGMTIEFLLLIVVVFFVVNTQYLKAIIIFALSIFWAWLLYTTRSTD